MAKVFKDGGFMDTAIHGKKATADGYALTDKEYDQLLADQAKGAQIIAGNDGKPSAVFRILSLEDTRAEKLRRLNEQSQAVADALTAGYPEFEKLTWEDQRREALAWKTDNAAPTPVIDKMAANRGIDRAEYLTRTHAKVVAFSDASSYLVGTRQKYADQINAATNEADLEAITPVFTLS